MIKGLLINSKIVSGVKLISELTQLESKIKDANLVITGEGKLDHQSLNGKVVNEVAKICKVYNKELWGVVGKNDLTKSELSNLGIQEIFTVIQQAKDDNDAMKNGKLYLKSIGQKMTDIIVNEMTQS